MRLFPIFALLIVLASCEVHNYINIPNFFEVNANSYYEAGYSLGKQTKDLIKYHISNDDSMQKKLIPFYFTEEGRKWFDHFVETNKRVFPEYMEELQGMADGSDTPFYELFLNMLQEEFSYVVPSEFKFQPSTHCSDYIMKTEDNSIIVHNEDGSGLIDFNKTIIVRERLTIDGKLVSNYTAFSYAAQIPTAAYGWNENILFSMNYLMTKTSDVNGVGRVFVGRYLLDAVDLDDAIRRLTEYSFAAGHNHQIIDRKTGRLVDVEIAPFQFYGVYVATPGRPHWHANSYNVCNADDVGLPNSIARDERAAEMKVPENLEEMIEVLGDTKHETWPIYNDTTLNTVVFDWKTMTLTIYIGNPKDGKIYTTIPFYLVFIDTSNIHVISFHNEYRVAIRFHD